MKSCGDCRNNWDELVRHGAQVILTPHASENLSALPAAHSLEVCDGETFLVDTSYNVVFG